MSFNWLLQAQGWTLVFGGTFAIGLFTGLALARMLQRDEEKWSRRPGQGYQPKPMSKTCGNCKRWGKHEFDICVNEHGAPNMMQTEACGNFQRHRLEPPTGGSNVMPKPGEKGFVPPSNWEKHQPWYE